MFLRENIKLELSQEHTLSELATQLKQYTDNYEASMFKGDEKAAYAWSQNRIKLLQQMISITGLEERETPEPINVTIKWI